MSRAATRAVALAVVIAVAAATGFWLGTRRRSGPEPPRGGEVLADIQWKDVPPGSFVMGCTPGDVDCHDDEKPAHRVTLTTGFRMAATETTNAQYRACVEAGVCALPTDRTAYDDPSKTDHPVVTVSWEEAEQFCRWVGGRLPTEAEWEYAARGGEDGSRYVWGSADSPRLAGRDMANVWDESTNWRHLDWGNGDPVPGMAEAWAGVNPEEIGLKNFAGYDDGYPGTSPVGCFPPNAFGLYDMAGNVGEYCADWFDIPYRDAALQDPTGPSSGTHRIVRGGSWHGTPRDLRVSLRISADPAERSEDVGVRCVRDTTSP